MASTNKTTNYELSQFEGTDKPSWEADYNADMLAIDTNLKAVSDVADGASGSISTLADRVTTAEGNITTNANDIDALEARADALEAGQTSDDSRLDAIEAEQIVQNTAIESNTRLGYNLARPYDSASTYSVGDYVLFQDTLYKCTTAVTTGEAFDPTKWLAIKATDEINNPNANIVYAMIGDGTLQVTDFLTYIDNNYNFNPNKWYMIRDYNDNIYIGSFLGKSEYYRIAASTDLLTPMIRIMSVSQHLYMGCNINTTTGVIQSDNRSHRVIPNGEYMYLIETDYIPNVYIHI